jgi:hypothetical protein
MTELLEYVQEEIKKEGAQKPQGHSYSVEDGQLAIARTGRAPREQKRRDVLKAIYEAGLQSHLPVRLIRSALAVVDPGSDQPDDVRAAYSQHLGRLHRSCRSVPPFMEELFLLPDLVAQIERTAGVNQAGLIRERDSAQAEALQARRHSQELESALESMRQRVNELQSDKEREVVSLRIQANAFEQAHNLALQELQAERAARVRAEALLSRTGGYAAEVQPLDIKEAESVARIKAEMEAQRRKDDERRARAKTDRY